MAADIEMKGAKKCFYLLFQPDSLHENTLHPIYFMLEV